MESKAREALYHLVLSSMDQLIERGDFDAWLEGDIELAPLFRPVFESVARQRDTFIRELHQMFPAEVVDRLRARHPDLDMGDGTRAIVRVGREIEAMKAIVQSL
ncbi:MAG: hypothetical protein AB1793_07530 [Candidatus Thermoplasmatota archaeon]